MQPRSIADAAADDDELTRLAERLLRHARDRADASREVLFELARDGVRCVVVRAEPRPAPGQELLSPREREIARMVADGQPNKTIAAVLDISAWTVNAHLRRIFAKLGVTSRAAMVAKLLRQKSAGS
ncbi:MAG TPA: helix-turn-helix transcriptional regulator [Thermoanaerobaculia bacterium]|jgi:DNA-binding CsgD family transcriptional regulator